jgi:hypothetical protein
VSTAPPISRLVPVGATRVPGLARGRSLQLRAGRARCTARSFFCTTKAPVSTTIADVAGACRSIGGRDHNNLRVVGASSLRDLNASQRYRASGCTPPQQVATPQRDARAEVARNWAGRHPRSPGLDVCPSVFALVICEPVSGRDDHVTRPYTAVACCPAAECQLFLGQLEIVASDPARGAQDRSCVPPPRRLVPLMTTTGAQVSTGRAHRRRFHLPADTSGRPLG